MQLLWQVQVTSKALFYNSIKKWFGLTKYNTSNQQQIKSDWLTNEVPLKMKMMQQPDRLVNDFPFKICLSIYEFIDIWKHTANVFNLWCSYLVSQAPIAGN